MCHADVCLPDDGMLIRNHRHNTRSGDFYCGGNGATEAASEAETTAAATEAETEVAATEVDKTVVSEQAKAIIEAVMNAPNPDLSFYPYMTTIGLDTSQDELESQMAETQEAKEQVYENWDNLLGQYFAAGSAGSLYQRRHIWPFIL